MKCQEEKDKGLWIKLDIKIDLPLLYILREFKFDLEVSREESCHSFGGLNATMSLKILLDQERAADSMNIEIFDRENYIILEFYSISV